MINLEGKAISAVKPILASGELPNLLFYGNSGTGKTTTAYAIANVKNYHIIEVNASNDRGIDAMRRILQCTRHIPFCGHQILFLDEADGLTTEAQELLRRPMETSKHTTFILAVNRLEAIIKPVQSRCVMVEFSLTAGDIINGLRKLNGSVSEQTLKEIAIKSCGDMRQAISMLKFYRPDEVSYDISKYLSNSK